MGTRCLTRLYNEQNEEIAVLYRQYDGYPGGHGKELIEFLDGMVVGNGIGSDMPKKYANGMECLAAQIVAHFKTEPGQFYLMPPGTHDVGEEYVYTVGLDLDGSLSVLCTNTYDDDTHYLMLKGEAIWHPEINV